MFLFSYLTKLLYAKPKKKFCKNLFLCFTIFFLKNPTDTVLAPILFNFSGEEPYVNINLPLSLCSKNLSRFHCTLGAEIMAKYLINHN